MRVVSTTVAFVLHVQAVLSPVNFELWSRTMTELDEFANSSPACELTILGKKVCICSETLYTPVDLYTPQFNE